MFWINDPVVNQPGSPNLDGQGQKYRCCDGVNRLQGHRVAQADIVNLGPLVAQDQFFTAAMIDWLRVSPALTIPAARARERERLRADFRSSGER